MPDRDPPGLDDPSGRFSVLSGSGARPGGAGGMDFADLVGAVQRIVDDPEAMATLRRYLDEGRDLRPALEATANTVPEAAPAIERLLADPGLVDDLGATLGDLVAGGHAPASGDGGPGVDALPGLLGGLIGGDH